MTLFIVFFLPLLFGSNCYTCNDIAKSTPNNSLQEINIILKNTITGNLGRQAYPFIEKVTASLKNIKFFYENKNQKLVLKHICYIQGYIPSLIESLDNKIDQEGKNILDQFLQQMNLIKGKPLMEDDDYNNMLVQWDRFINFYEQQSYKQFPRLLENVEKMLFDLVRDRFKRVVESLRYLNVFAGIGDQENSRRYVLKLQDLVQSLSSILGCKHYFKNEDQRYWNDYFMVKLAGFMKQVDDILKKNSIDQESCRSLFEEWNSFTDTCQQYAHNEHIDKLYKWCELMTKTFYAFETSRENRIVKYKNYLNFFQDSFDKLFPKGCEQLPQLQKIVFSYNTIMQKMRAVNLEKVTSEKFNNYMQELTQLVDAVNRQFLAVQIDEDSENLCLLPRFQGIRAPITEKSEKIINVFYLFSMLLQSMIHFSDEMERVNVKVQNFDLNNIEHIIEIIREVKFYVSSIQQYMKINSAFNMFEYLEKNFGSIFSDIMSHIKKSPIDVNTVTQLVDKYEVIPLLTELLTLYDHDNNSEECVEMLKNISELVCKRCADYKKHLKVINDKMMRVISFFFSPATHGSLLQAIFESNKNGILSDNNEAQENKEEKENKEDLYQKFTDIVKKIEDGFLIRRDDDLQKKMIEKIVLLSVNFLPTLSRKFLKMIPRSKVDQQVEERYHEIDQDLLYIYNRLEQKFKQHMHKFHPDLISKALCKKYASYLMNHWINKSLQLYIKKNNNVHDGKNVIGKNIIHLIFLIKQWIRTLLFSYEKQDKGIKLLQEKSEYFSTKQLTSIDQENLKVFRSIYPHLFKDIVI